MLTHSLPHKGEVRQGKAGQEGEQSGGRGGEGRGGERFNTMQCG